MTERWEFLFGYTNIVVNCMIILIIILNFVVHKFRQLQEAQLTEEKTRLLSLSTRELCYRFSLDQMQRATSNFHDDLVIGKGGYGNVYKGTFQVGPTVVAIKRKRLGSMSNQGSVEFRTEIEMLSKLRHSNLVSLIGYCDDGYEMILVYEFMPGGTLADHLYKKKRQGDQSAPTLSWVQRLKVCSGAARGLDYLHTGTGIQHRIIHRDVKTTNILLDENCAAKISDFGLSKTSPANQATTHVSTHVKGTFGYFDPNYYQTGRLTWRSDVYSFGVVLFEVLCGRPAVDHTLEEEQIGLVGWAQHCFRENIMGQIIDPRIKEEACPDSVEALVKVAIQCIHIRPKNRPTMAEVVVRLESALALQEKSTEYDLPEIIDSEDDQGEEEISDIEVETGVLPGILQSSKLKKYTQEDLSVATRDFRRHSELGGGRYQLVCKDWVRFGAAKSITGLVIAEERIEIRSALSLWEEKWLKEINILGELDHPNIVNLVGYCLENKALVYKFMPRGSLVMHLFRRGSDFPLLSWELRIIIALGAAKGLAYIHSPKINVIHGDITASNILIDSEYNAKLFNFRTVIDGLEFEEGQLVFHKMEAVEYLAPEYIQSGHLSVKTDVYSFGVVLLVILTGRKPFDADKEVDLVLWAKNACVCEGATILDLIDADIQGQYSVRAALTASYLALKCLSPNPESRPDAEQVVEELEQLLDSK